MSQPDSFNIRGVIKKVVFHWPLFLLFFSITFSIAFFYLRYTQPLYDIEATILIKDPVNKAPGGVALQELNLSSGDKGVETEIGLIKSIPNIEQVVIDLQLWVTYTQKTKYYNYRDIYKSTPLLFKLVKANKGFKYEVFDVTVLNKDSFLLKQTDGTFKQCLIKNTFNSSSGSWKLEPTEHLKEFIGQTIRINLHNPKDVVKYYQNKIDAVNLVKTNPTITLNIEDEVPERGTAILNDLLRVYTAASVEDKRKSTQSTLQFLETRINSLTGELNGVEKSYEGYKSSRGITEVSAESAKYLEDQQITDNKINEVNIQLSLIEGIEQYISSGKNDDNPPATIGMTDPGLTGLVKQLSELQSQRVRMLATLPESNPLFIPVNQQIASTKNSLKENVKGIKASLLRTKSHLQSLGATYQSSIQSIPVHERELVDIKRMQGIKENLYVYLLQKKEEISLDYASTISDARIEEQPHYGEQKSPIPKQVYAIAFLFGFLVPVSLIFGRQAIRNTILSKKEITQGTGAPVLAEIIFEEHSEPLRVLNNNRFISEQFRNLRTNLNYLLGNGNKGKMTLLTSSISGEGKSFISSNLAVALATAGKRTVLLEIDLRRPQLSKYFQIPKNQVGLTDYLHGDATLSQIVIKSEVDDNLHIIPAGKLPPNPSELLEDQRLLEMFNQLRQDYDHILLDSPPVHLVTDGTILATHCDLTLYVVRQDYTPKPELNFIKELVESKKFPRTNIVFNGVKRENADTDYVYTQNNYYTNEPASLKVKMKQFISRF
jgi:capsular exopolysaccharide synthesis family protein